MQKHRYRTFLYTLQKYAKTYVKAPGSYWNAFTLREPYCAFAGRVLAISLSAIVGSENLPLPVVGKFPAGWWDLDLRGQPRYYKE